MESRVGVLDVRIRAAGEPSPALVSATRGFACRVLERCDEILEQRAPGRLVFMRYLEMQWRLWERGVESADEVEAVAREMAGALDEQARACPAIPDAQAEIVVFDDEVHYRAEYLRAVAERRAEQCWFFEKLLDEGAAPGILGRSEHRELTEAVLTKLTSDGLLERVLAGLSRTAVDDLARVLAIARPLPIGIAGDSPLVAVHQAVARFAGADSRGSPGTHTPRRRQDSARLTLDNARDATDVPAPVPVPPTESSEVDGVETAFGGLFYLLTPALELSLGEVLWRACLPETAVFTRLAEAILGAEASADPASRLFGGAAPDTSLTAVTEEQHAEVAKTTLAATVEAFSRRPDTELPSVRLFLAAVATRRLLVAAPLESPFAVFAWPADSADALKEGLGTFLAHWPANAPPPSAHPALASVDRSGRIRSMRSLTTPPVLFPEHDDLLATALLAQAAGSLAFLFAARAGADISSPAQLVERYLTVPAHVVVTDEEMEIRMPMERIDFAVRGAGLDRDPGWVPWLQKRVRFVFGGDVERA